MVRPSGADRVEMATRFVCARRAVVSALAPDLPGAEAGVAVLPGTAFGAAGKGFIRLAYTQSEDELKLGLSRIKEFVAANKA